MNKITVVFKNSSEPIKFIASDIKLLTSTEEGNYGQLVGYEISTDGTYTSHVFLDVKEVAGVLAISDDLVEKTEIPNNE